MKQAFDHFEILDQTNRLQPPKVSVSSIELVKSLLGEEGGNALLVMEIILIVCREDGALCTCEELEECGTNFYKESQLFLKQPSTRSATHWQKLKLYYFY